MPFAIRRIQLTMYGILIACIAADTVGMYHRVLPLALIVFPIALLVGWAQYASP